MSDSSVKVALWLALYSADHDALRRSIWPIRRALERPEPPDHRAIDLGLSRTRFLRFFSAALANAQRNLQKSNEETTSFGTQITCRLELLVLDALREALTSSTKQTPPEGLAADTCGRKRLARADLEALRAISLGIEDVAERLKNASERANEERQTFLAFAATTVRNAVHKYREGTA
ncbi:hypothetical protein [Rudaea sp.]|uniref:hypothetical protein n=1 Tax=Rudaea sp. TaxID=2136325 RepID=UPI003784C84E